MRHTVDFYSWIYCLSLFAFICLRALFSETLDLITIFLVLTYFFQNFIVNSIDYLIYRKALGYYEDVIFQQMFSYKLYQFTICLTLALIFSQTLHPSFTIILNHPVLLKHSFKLTIPLNLLMLITFLFELTFFDQKVRKVIFKT